MSDSPAVSTSLTQDEASARAELIEVERYDIDVDLRGLLEGTDWRATSTVRFTCRRPGAATFVDCVAEVEQAVLNGVELDLETIAEGRIPLPGLAAHNTLVVGSVQRDTGSGNAILRSVDPKDGLVYVWSTFEPDGARRAWACFDQPDLKAVHAFTASAPVDWTVFSNAPPTATADLDDGGRRWTFQETPLLSTYVVVINAGPFHEIRERRGDHDLGLSCRQSLRPYLERDAEELLALTEQGLAFFGERFDLPFPQERYDQVFVPSFGGAMENWGCVTWTDAMLYRSAPSHRERESRAILLLHEMAHMWFGDLVTMRWWDDLWLNEAFASFASTWAAGTATEFTDVWAAFAAGEERLAYQQDMSPATHPIRSEVPDVAHAFATFDAVTYFKGQAVLRQLMALVTEDVFAAGLAAYFGDHAWGNATLTDLIGAVGTAAGRDLTAWTKGWLDRAGTDRLSLAGSCLVASGPDGGPPLTHALRVGSYARAEHRGLERVGDLVVETDGPATTLDLPDADLHLVNDGDLTFASVRFDPASLPVLLHEARDLPDPLGRALVAATAWDMLATGQLGAGDVLDCLLGVLGTEQSPGVLAPLIELTLRTAEQWSPPELAADRLAQLADLAVRRAGEPDHRTAVLQALAWSATSPEHFGVLDAASADSIDLAWRTLARRAALGEFDETAVTALLERDPDPEVEVRAHAVRAARPTEAAKAEAWDLVWRRRAIPSGLPLVEFGRCFWRPGQWDLLVPWAHRYLDEVTSLSGGGLLALGGLVRLLRPMVCDATWLDRAREVADDPATPPFVRTELLMGSDTLGRVLRARG